MMELGCKGKLTRMERVWCRRAILRKGRCQNAVEAEGATYGMGLRVDKHWGVTVVDHGGDVWGYHADMIWLPDYGVGTVILNNGDQENVLVSSLMPPSWWNKYSTAGPEADQQLEFA